MQSSFDCDNQECNTTWVELRGGFGGPPPEFKKKL
jgi:hypothetical protein